MTVLFAQKIGKEVIFRDTLPCIVQKEMFDKLTSRSLLSRTGAFKKGVLRPLFPLHKGSRVSEACHSPLPWGERGDKKHFGLAQKASLNCETKAFSLSPFPFLSWPWRRKMAQIWLGNTHYRTDSRARRERIFSLESDFPLFFRDGKYGKRRGGGGAVPPSRIINSNCPSLLLLYPLSLSPPSLSSELSAFATTLCHYGV